MGYVVVCAGFQDTQQTECFLQSLQTVMPAISSQWLIFPSDRDPPYSGWHVLQFLQTQLPDRSCTSAISFIGFSAGTIAAISAAHGWQCQGGTVQRVIALDGWGVPLWGDFPIHRLSHDFFTHWSSALLGTGQDSFYADPSVTHLELWRSPHTVHGWIGSPFQANPQRTTAAQFILEHLG
jgi:hypothetical protein